MKRFKTKKRNNKIKLFIMIFILIISCILFLKIFNKLDKDKLSKNLLKNTINTDTILKKELLENSISTVVLEEPKKDPILYIYNTHQTEEFAPGNLQNYNISPTVYMLSNILKKELERYGIYSVVEDANIKTVLNENNWTYKDSYKASRILLEKVKNEYPTIKYYLDLHRDSVSSKITINEITYAKIMLVLGMNHKNYEENEKLMIKINDYLNNNYNGISRDILYAKNNIFNQDFDNNVFLVEVGGNENTLEEVYNSTIPLAEAISYVIGK